MTNHDLMVRAAWMYYHDDLTHAQIAAKLHLSRVKVTRLLKRAREQGIVEIRVLQPMPPDLEMSRTIEAAFGLQQALVVPVGGVARAAADSLLYGLADGDFIGFGWSRNVSSLVEHIVPQPNPCDCTIIDLVGSMLGKANPYSISARVADLLQARLMPLAVPVVVSSATAHKTLLAEPGIEETLSAAGQCKTAFVGVGEAARTSTLVEIDFLPAPTMDTLRSRGAVGEMLMRFFDIDGRPVQHETDDRIIGLTWEGLQNIPNVVLVAQGSHKAHALLGALRSGIPGTLITDMPTANALLEML